MLLQEFGDDFIPLRQFGCAIHGYSAVSGQRQGFGSSPQHDLTSRSVLPGDLQIVEELQRFAHGAVDDLHGRVASRCLLGGRG